MSLRAYKEKRDFTRTAEPPPKTGGRGEQSFVVQKHDASRLHYDFRLAMGGTLKSWAVPKGFPWTQGERHLAVHVEDHPLEYAKFEGIIPKGEYGGGTVMVWDAGHFEVLGDEPLRALHRGKLHLHLKGRKLQGEWTLVRTRTDEEKEHWLLMKSGADAKPLSPREDDKSVLTGRTLEQIAAEKKATWRSNRTVANRASAEKKVPVTATSAMPRRGRRKSAALKFIEPMKAKLVSEPPSRGEWIYELKWDGYRALIIKDGPLVEIYSRNQKLLTAEFPELRDAVSSLGAERAVIDGEIVALNAEGQSSFQLLQARAMGRKRPPIFLYAFDLLHLDRRDLLRTPLIERKHLLGELLRLGPETIRFSANLEGDIRAILREIRLRGMEGVVGKRSDSLYEPGARDGTWVKVKCGNVQEFVIGGFTDPQGSRPYLGALHVGYFEGEEFRYAGKVGTGFDAEMLRFLRGKLDRLRTEQCPFTDIPTKNAGKWTRNMSPAAMRAAHWTKAKLVCQLEFAEWTQDAALRQPVFLGLRKDKEPREVIRERPA